MLKYSDNKWVVLLLLLLQVNFAGAKEQTDPEANKLWYKQPAKKWLQALPIGNGTLGAMIYGGVEQEHIQFNESSLVTGTTKTIGSYQPFGDVFIAFTGLKAENYRRELDLSNAVQRVSFTSGGVNYKREYFASYPDKVIVLKLSADQKGKISFKIKLSDAHQALISVKENRISAEGRLAENDMEYGARLQVLNDGGKLSSSGSEITVSNADQVRILLTAGTSFVYGYESNYKGENPAKRLDRIIEKAAQETYPTLFKRHVSDYGSLFNRVQLYLGKGSDLSTIERLNAYKKGSPDQSLTALLFQYGRYLLISSSRPGGLPANLQGLWNEEYKPAWYSQYTTNINVQMNYWPAEPTDLAECAAPFFDWVENLALVQKRSGDPMLATAKGWIAYSTNNAMGGASTWGIHRPGSAWLSQHFWEHYAFGGDKAFLAKRAFPMLKDVSGYWEDHLVLNDKGKYITPDGWSPEHGPGKKEGDRTPYPGVSYDQQIVYDLFSNYIEAAAIINKDDAHLEKITRMRNQLLGPQIGRWGQLQEWMEDVDDQTDRHRHNSHLFAVHPGRQISPLSTKKLAKAALVSLNSRGDSSTGWSTAWKINLFARLQEGNRANDFVKILFNKSIADNLFDLHPPFQIDGNLGYTAGVAEMLLQSHVREEDHYVVQLLPALPSSWDSGFLKGLRARGGFKVDINWQKGKMLACTIKSLSGNKVKIAYGQHSIILNTEKGKIYKLNRAKQGLIKAYSGYDRENGTLTP